MSWLSDEEQAVIASVQASIAHPSLPGIVAKLKDAKAELAKYDPMISLFEMFFPHSIAMINAGEAIVTELSSLANQIPNV